MAAIRAAQCGKRVAIVEKADAGGVCLNWGCIPTKALVRSAQVFADCKAAATYGVAIEGEVKPDWTKMVERERTVASTMNKGVQFLLKKNNIDLIAGFGRLKAADVVEVEGVDYQADNIILATGARPRVMPFMPIDGKHIISSKEALVLPELPESMVVATMRSRSTIFVQLGFTSPSISTPNAAAALQSANTCAERTRALVGIQPQLRHTPPASAFSTIATRLPHWAARIAAT